MPAGHRRTGPVLVALLAALVATMVAGCTADAGSTVRTVATMTRSGCPTDFPQRLTLTTPASPATPPLGDLRACTGHGGDGPVFLYNGGRAAWQTMAAGHAFRVLGGDTWTRWLRARVAIAPSVVLPGESVLLWAPPDAAAWRLDGVWTVAWTSLEAGVHALPGHGEDSRAKAAGDGSLRGRALVSCALTALHLRRAPSMVGPVPAATAPASGAPLTPTVPTPSSGAVGASGGQGGGVVRGLTGLDALQATWSPNTSACSADWERSDHALESRGTPVVRWWTAWQRAKTWLALTARELQWLDAAGNVVVRTRL